MATNPYIKRYKKRLQKREKSRKRHQKNETISKLAKATAVGAGVVAGIHSAHPKGIIGALDDVGKYATSAQSAIRETYDRYATSRSIVGKFKNYKKMVSDIGKSIGKGKPQGAGKTLTKAFNKAKNKTDDLHISRMRKQINKLTGIVKGNLKRDARREYMVKGLDRLAEENKGYKDMVDTLKKQKQTRLGDMGKNMSISEFRNEMKKIGIENDDFTDEVWKLMEGAKKDIDIGDVSSKKKEIENLLINEGVIKPGEADSGNFITNAIKDTFGYKKATAKDLIENDSIDIDESTKNFLYKLRDEHGADLEKFVPDESLYKYKGKIVGSNRFREMGMNIRSGFSKGLLGKVTHQRDFQMMKQNDRKAGVLMKSGYHQFTLSDTDVVNEKGVLQETLIGVNNKIYKMSDPGGKPIKEGVHFASGKYGSASKMIGKMSGVNSPDWGREDGPWWENHWLDMTNQRDPGLFSKIKSFFTKGKDRDYMPNKAKEQFVVAEIANEFRRSGKVDPENVPGLDMDVVNELHSYMKNQVEGFSPRTLEKLTTGLDDAELRDLSFGNEEELTNAFVKLSQKTEGIDEKTAREVAERTLSQTRTATRKGVGQTNKMHEGKDLLRKKVSRQFVNYMGDDNAARNLAALNQTGIITGDEFEQGMHTIQFAKFDKELKASEGMSTLGLEELFAEPDSPGQRGPFQSSITRLFNKSHPKMGYGSLSSFKNNFKSDVIPIEKFDYTDPSSYANIFTAGRENMSDINLGTLGTYGTLSRLNDMVNHFDFMPLAMSDDSMGSPADITKNIMGKRVLPIYAGMEAVKWANDYIQEETGYTLNQHKERAKAHTRLGIAGVKDKVGLTDAFAYLDELTPGSEGLTTALKDIPVAGWAADYTGIFSGKSKEDWIDYYKNGEEPVRKGRFWALGTNPWMGGKITHHRPNDYKMAMSEWQYTDTVYGSREKYWSHNWMPSPSHPMAPVKHFVTDRYWFEEMHRKDRPYPLSGEMFDPNTPWGAVLNPTIGKIAKPVKKYTTGASKEDLRKREEKVQETGARFARYHRGKIQQSVFVPKTSSDKQGGVPIMGGGTGEIEIDASNLSKEEIAVIQSQRGQGASYSGDHVRYGGGTGEPGIAIDGKTYSQAKLSSINKNIIDKAKGIKKTRSLKEEGFVVPYYDQEPNKESIRNVKDPRSFSYSAERALDLTKDIAGLKGFLASSLTGGNDYGEGDAVIQTASDAYATSSRFWNQTPGGRGGAISEIVRRFVNKKPGLTKKINNIPNTMPGWLPDKFKKGDAYSSIKGGEYRLPGEAYRSMHQTHPDKYGDVYGAVDRAAILADVAPYSQEYKFWSKVAKSQDLTAEEDKFLKQALEQKRKENERYHLTKYKFLGKELERKKAKIDKFVDENRFKIKGSDQVYRLAGVYGSMNPEKESGKAMLETLQSTMLPGTDVTIKTSPHDSKGSKAAIVYSDNSNVNKLLRKRGVKKREESGVIGTHLRTGVVGRQLGKLWEIGAHAQVPFLHNKIMNVNSPKEHYERKNLYGKQWMSWQEPVEDFIKPTFQNAAAQHPLGAMVGGVTAGFLTGLILGGPGFRKATTALGALTAGTMSLNRMAKETATGEAWIPKRREKERDIQKYYDLLENIKYKRLYNKYAEVAKKKEGTDVKKLVKELEEMDEKLKEKERRIDNIAENIEEEGLDKEDSVKTIINSNGRVEHKVVSKEEYIQDLKQNMKKDVKEEKEKDIMVDLGPYARKAVEYRQKYKSTLAAIDEDSTFEQMFKAMPKKEQEYFNKFSQVEDPEKRKEILKLVPDNQKKAYKILWGMETDEKEKSIKEMLEGYYLPKKNWVGWKEGVELEDSIIKLLKNQELDPKDFGLWQDYTEDEQLTPAPTPVGRDYDEGVSQRELKHRVEEVLKEYNVHDLEVDVKPRDDEDVNIAVDIAQDVKHKVQAGIATALGG